MKMIFDFAEITRLDDEKREAQGYAFRNEVVEGEGGIRLSRAAMEAATGPYMEFGNLRSMHQPIAAGVVQDAKWDEKGMYITTRVVDDNEWKKVKEGVYKGFSVGVRPRVMRGKTVEAADIIEISLVDRPKDPDALISCFRSESVENLGEITYRSNLTAEERDNLPDEDFADPKNRKFPILDQDDVDSAALLLGQAENPEEVKKNIIALAKKKGLELPESWEEDVEDESRMTNPDLTARTETESSYRTETGSSYQTETESSIERVLTLEAEIVRLVSDNEDLLQRLKKAEADFVEVQVELDSAKAQIAKLKDIPVKPPVRFPKAFEREYSSNTSVNNNSALQDEIVNLKKEIASTTDENKKLQLLARLNVLASS